MEVQRCTICGALEDLSACKTCKTTYYCSNKCQQLDRPLHELLCKEFTAFLATRPANRVENGTKITSKAAILLGVDDKIPKLIWIESHLFKKSKGKELLKITSSIYRSLQLYMQDTRIEQPCINGHDIEVASGTGSTTTAKENNVLLSLTDGYDYAERWIRDLMLLKGNIVIARTKKERSSATYQRKIDLHHDISVADLRYGIHYLSQDLYYNIFDGGFHNNRFVLREEAGWSSGVKVFNPLYLSCPKIVNKPYLEVHVKHPRSNLYEKHEWMYKLTYVEEPTDLGSAEVDVCAISVEMKMPLNILKLPRELPQGSNIARKRKVDVSNHLFNSFLLNATPTSPRWGKCSITWEETDHLLVCRQDKGNMNQRELEAFIEFCRQILEPAMIASSEASGGTLEQREEVVTKYMHSTAFEDFFKELRDAEMADHVSDWDWTEVLRRDLSEFEVEL